MKKHLWLLPIIACGITLNGHAQEKVKEVELKELIKLEEFGPMIIHVNSGDKIPLDFTLSGEVLAFHHTPEKGAIVAMQPFFIKAVDIEQGVFFFSKNKKEWKTFEDFFGGSFGVSTTNKETPITLSLELNFK